MATVTSMENKTATDLLGEGIRAYIMDDYNTAIQVLGKASEMLVEEHGSEIHDSLGDVYLYYGKALLGLSRDETGALGDAVPKNVEEESDEAEEVEEENTEEEEEEKPQENGSDTPAPAVETNGEGPSSSSSTAEGTAESKPEEEPTDLELGWEVLELAKKIFAKRPDGAPKQLADTLIVLGEIALESENFETGINDIKQGLDMQRELFPKDSRTVAETLYKLGVAYSIGSKLDEAIDCFKEALEYLQNRLKTLEDLPDKKSGDLDEIKEVKELLPDVEEKIADMKSCKEEAEKKAEAEASAPEPQATSTSTSSAQPKDISHLVKRKRKLEDEEANGSVANPAKKPSI